MWISRYINSFKRYIMQLKRNPHSRCQFPPLHPVPSASLFCCRPGSRTLNTKRQEWTQYTEIQKLIFKKTNKQKNTLFYMLQCPWARYCYKTLYHTYWGGYGSGVQPASWFFFKLFFFWPCGFIDRTGSRYNRKQDEREGGGVTHSKWSPGWDLNLGPTKPLYMGRPLYQLSSTVPEASVLLTEGHWFDP